MALLMLIGMRRGEVMGLRWKDIDFDQKVVHIRRNNTQITGEGAHIGTTKKRRTAQGVSHSEIISKNC